MFKILKSHIQEFSKRFIEMHTRKKLCMDVNFFFLHSNILIFYFHLQEFFEVFFYAGTLKASPLYSPVSGFLHTWMVNTF